MTTDHLNYEWLNEYVSSPCCGCEKEFEDKEECCLRCDRLRQWQVKDDPAFIDKLVEGSERGDLRKARRCGYRCERCGGRIRFLDGVVYCRDCLRVFVRTDDHEVVKGAKRSAGKAAKRMKKAGWDWEHMARVLRMNVRYVQKLTGGS